MSNVKFKREPWRFAFVIRNGVGAWKSYQSFDEAMKHWEGFNLPYLELDGVREPFKRAYARLKRWQKLKTKMEKQLP
ncbi:MAG: hypothetical protein K8R92_00925 [Planctomycetes bacterium]|nr:hypothetical protein [Planctomycetota bacterium]